MNQDTKPGSDYITTMSQMAGNRPLGVPDPFPFIPDPPPGFDAESNPIRTEGSNPQEGKPKKVVNDFIPNARVFVIGEDGNPEYDHILRQGASGQLIIGKKEVADMRGSGSFKVYLEWLVPVK